MMASTLHSQPITITVCPPRKARGHKSPTTWTTKYLLTFADSDRLMTEEEFKELSRRLAVVDGMEAAKKRISQLMLLAKWSDQADVDAMMALQAKGLLNKQVPHGAAKQPAVIK